MSKEDINFYEDKIHFFNSCKRRIKNKNIELDYFITQDLKKIAYRVYDFSEENEDIIKDINLRLPLETMQYYLYKSNDIRTCLEVLKLMEIILEMYEVVVNDILAGKFKDRSKYSVLYENYYKNYAYVAARKREKEIENEVAIDQE